MGHLPSLQPNVPALLPLLQPRRRGCRAACSNAGSPTTHPRRTCRCPTSLSRSAAPPLPAGPQPRRPSASAAAATTRATAARLAWPCRWCRRLRCRWAVRTILRHAAVAWRCRSGRPRRPGAPGARAEVRGMLQFSVPYMVQVLYLMYVPYMYMCRVFTFGI
jgi:hypothetical protein